MNKLFKSFIKKYWLYKTPSSLGTNSYYYTHGILYKPIGKVISLLNQIYELRLPRYNLNDTFPLDKDGYTKITHSLLLEYGRYYSDGPLLSDDVKDVKFIGKGKHGLVIHIDMYRSKGHTDGITIKNATDVIMSNVIIKGYWK